MGETAEAALARFESRLSEKPSSAAAHLGRGRALMELERWEEAETALGRLLELAPDDYTGHRGLAQVLAHSGRGADALAHAERAVALAPEGERAAAEALLADLRALTAGEDS